MGRLGRASLSARFVLAILSIAVGGCERRDASSTSSEAPRPSGSAEPQSRHDRANHRWFAEITSESGIDFTYDPCETGDLLTAEAMGAGVALFDADNDEDLDIYLTNGNAQFRRGGDVDGRALVNRFYRQARDRTFVDDTAASGLGDDGYGMGVAVGDIDNDGDEDVYVTNLGPDRLYRNRGDGTFEDITIAAGIDVPGWSSSAAFFDLDLDGFLDLYVAQYVEFERDKACSDRAGLPDFCGPLAFDPVHDVLLSNNGDGTFSDVSERAGIVSTRAASLGVACEDFNDDGWTDLYVANDAYANNLWINQQDGTFRDDALVMGAAYNLHGQAEAGMGVVVSDFDGDARPDLFMTHLRNESNTLYRNTGFGFADATGASGLGSVALPNTGFGVAAFDIELDGDIDLFVGNGGIVRADPHPDSTLRSPWNELAESNHVYLNDGSGRFAPAGAACGDPCRRAEITRGVAVGDVDNDGDLDLLLSNIYGPTRLYRNQAPRSGHWLSVRAIDRALGRDAIGARLVVHSRDRRWAATISRATSYLSSGDVAVHFGLGAVTEIDGVEIIWPGGVRERFDVAAVDRQLRFVRGDGTDVP